MTVFVLELYYVSFQTRSGSAHLSPRLFRVANVKMGILIITIKQLKTLPEMLQTEKL